MKKLLSISLALIILMSNVGFTYATHFCGGEAVKSQMMIGHNHLDCGMHGMDMGKSDSEKDVDYFKSSDCCKNHYQTFEIKEDYQNKNIQLSFQIDFVVDFFHSFNIIVLPEIENPQYEYYFPPLLQRDIPVLNQVFII